MFLRGRDAGAGVDPNRETRSAMKTGGAIGDQVGSFQLDEFRSHNHSGVPWYAGEYTGSIIYNPATATVGQIINATDMTGGNETRPTNIYVNYIIKY
jgi:hypothetical protein